MCRLLDQALHIRYGINVPDLPARGKVWPFVKGKSSNHRIVHSPRQLKRRYLRRLGGHPKARLVQGHCHTAVKIVLGFYDVAH